MGRRETFDVERAFVANKSFLFGGKRIVQDAPFDDRSDLRRFRQLYDGRFTRMLPPDQTPAKPFVDDGPDFAAMSEIEVQAWMRERGVVAHPRTPKQGLIRKARLLYEEGKAGITRPPLPPESTEIKADGIAPGGGEQLRQEGSGKGVQEPTSARRPSTRTRIQR